MKAEFAFFAIFFYPSEYRYGSYAATLWARGGLLLKPFIFMNIYHKEAQNGTGRGRYPFQWRLAQCFWQGRFCFFGENRA
jgi:hypothetical protein